MAKYYVDHVFAKSVAFTLFSIALLVGGSIFIYKKLYPQVRFVSRFPEMWYPREAVALRQKIALLLDGAPDQKRATCPWLMFVPHAGYDYSGHVAAAAYQACFGSASEHIKRVILLSPSHYVDFNGMALPPFDVYQTPLGDVEVDTMVVEDLKRDRSTGIDDLVFHREHAIDVQIPWIQTCMPHAQIVPLVIGRLPDAVIVDHLASLLVKWVDSSTLVIVSTDLVHYGKRFNFAPFAQSPSIQHDIENLEHRVMSAISHLDRARFESILDETGAAVCGKNVIRVALEIAQQGWAAAGDRMTSLREQSEGVVLKYDTSAAIRHLSVDESEKYESVGYGAIAAFAKT